MGMDVYGKKPTAPVGEYFRANVWSWHPIWEFCEDNFEIAKSVQNGHSNDGDGLDAEGAKELADGIRYALAEGIAQKYVEERTARLDAMPDEPCDLCGATGIRTDQIGRDSGQPTWELSEENAKKYGRTHGTCNGCNGKGSVRPWKTNYWLSIDNIENFLDFVENSGGFRIC